MESPCHILYSFVVCYMHSLPCHSISPSIAASTPFPYPYEGGGRGRAAQRAAEMDPLLRRRPSHHLLRRARGLQPGATPNLPLRPMASPFASPSPTHLSPWASTTHTHTSPCAISHPPTPPPGPLPRPPNPLTSLLPTHAPPWADPSPTFRSSSRTTPSTACKNRSPSSPRYGSDTRKPPRAPFPKTLRPLRPNRSLHHVSLPFYPFGFFSFY